jgi:hypothetical protein
MCSGFIIYLVLISEPNVDWHARMNVAIDAAKGLKELHLRSDQWSLGTSKYKSTKDPWGHQIIQDFVMQGL